MDVLAEPQQLAKPAAAAVVLSATSCGGAVAAPGPVLIQVW